MTLVEAWKLKNPKRVATEERWRKHPTTQHPDAEEKNHQSEADEKNDEDDVIEDEMTGMKNPFLCYHQTEADE